MENILKVIYDLSMKNCVLNIKSIDKILSILIDEKELNEYILNIDVQQIRSNNLASYSNYYKKITIYSNVIDKMITDIETSIKVNNQLTKHIYINLSILQVVLHEIEHANQERIINDNTLESFILRIAQIVGQEKQNYEVSPVERFAEIKSYNDISKIIVDYKKDQLLKSLISNDEMQRKIRGYHYNDGKLFSPIELYFLIGQKAHLLSSFDWHSKNDSAIRYDIEECLFYGFPIDEKSYCDIMNNLIINLKKNYKNKINVVKH